jgi:opacity protein-like surface antigen
MSIVVLFSLSVTCFAQRGGDGSKIEITPFGGFQWNSRTNTYGGYITTKDGLNFGGTIDFEVRPDFDIELLYIYFPSEAKIVIENAGFSAYASDYVDVVTHYMQVGYIRSIQKGGKVEPFGAVTIGAVLFQGSDVRLANGTTVGADDLWRFGFTLGGGAKIYLSDRIGLRLQARLMAPLYFSGGGVYFGTGGSGFGVSGGVPILQGDFTGGLIIRL